VAPRTRPKIVISDERAELLDTGGGVVKALSLLGGEPFFHLNSDTLWTDGATPNLVRLARRFDAARMDALLLLAPMGSIGYAGRGDFHLLADGRLRRRTVQEAAPFIYAGVAILAPALFAGAPEEAFSLTCLFDRAEAAGRLYGLPIEGIWMHLGTPQAIALAEAVLGA